MQILSWFGHKYTLPPKAKNSIIFQFPQVFQRSKLLHAHNGVDATADNYDEIEAEADYIEHDDDTGKTTLLGDARIFDDEKEATAEKIIYTKKDDIEEAVLTGNPELIRDDTKAFAQKIEYKKDDDNNACDANYHSTIICH